MQTLVPAQSALSETLEPSNALALLKAEHQAVIDQVRNIQRVSRIKCPQSDPTGVIN